MKNEKFKLIGLGLVGFSIGWTFEAIFNSSLEAFIIGTFLITGIFLLFFDWDNGSWNFITANKINSIHEAIIEETIKELIEYKEKVVPDANFYDIIGYLEGIKARNKVKK